MRLTATLKTVLLQMQTGFRKALKKISPEKHMRARVEEIAYRHGERHFADDDLWCMTEDGHECEVPTWQFWHSEGAFGAVLSVVAFYDNNIIITSVCITHVEQCLASKGWAASQALTCLSCSASQHG